MTKNELIAFKKMYANFENDCNRVCNILKRFDRDHAFLDTFKLSDDVVECTGDEYWNYGGHEEYYKVFDAEYLTMTNDELNKMVDEWIEQKEKAERIKQEHAKKVQEEKERKMLQELKEKYE